eukprot:1104947-Pelagomonas_calceolata.AAC.2
MGMKFASKLNGTLVVKFQLFKLVKGVLSLTGPTDTQKDDICMPLYRFQLLPRPSSFTKFLISIKCTYRFTLSCWGCLARVVVLDLCGVLCLLRNTWYEEKEEEEQEEGENYVERGKGVHPMHVLSKPAPQGLYLKLQSSFFQLHCGVQAAAP